MGHLGITVRHARSCAGDPCTCRPRYQAHVWDRRTKQRIRKTFASVSEAKAWRRDFSSDLASGRVKPPTRVTLDQAAEAWLAGARDGSIRNRSGDPFKPSVLRTYEGALRNRILPALGHLKLSDISRTHIQDLADHWLAEGLDPSTVRNTLMPLRVIFRRAVNRSEVGLNPCAGLELPSARGRRDRIVAPDQAHRLVAALEGPDAALWATALYAGLRRGELQALKWSDADLAAGVIRVERAWDQLEGETTPKSHAGTRKIPIAAVLRRHLIEHKLSAADSNGYVFPAATGRPFNPAVVQRQADAAWKAAGLDRITLHEARHTAASLMIAAGLNPKTVSTYLGHASISITLDRYGHLFPGSEDQAVALLDAFLERASMPKSS